MQHDHFIELRDWSERKHELVSNYLTGFVRIVGGFRKGSVYYVDGFAGPGIYNDGAKGSPIHAAEYARSLVGKDYKLRCINVEADPACFQTLESSTEPYREFICNHQGPFKNHVSHIITTIGESPAIFFLDPFGIKGIEWQHIEPILNRVAVTEVLLRINPIDISRLAGFSSSDSRGAEKKRQVLTDLYGFSDSTKWEEVWNENGTDGLVLLYKKRLLSAMPTGEPYVCSYAIRSIDGKVKYYLLFATCNAKGAILMSNVVYNREKNYVLDVKEYDKQKQEQQTTRQLSMIDTLCPIPTESEATTALVTELKEDICQEFTGKTASRIKIHAQMLPNWFGRMTGSHVTQALKELEENGSISNRTGQRSNDYTLFTFNSVT